MIRINSFVMKPSRNWTRVMKHLLPYLLETLIMMTKSNVITKRVALPIVVQIGIGGKTTMMRIVRIKSMQNKSL